MLRAKRAWQVCGGHADQGRCLEAAWLSASDRGGMGVCVPFRGSHQPLLRFEHRPVGAVCAILQVARPRALPCGSLLPNDLGLSDMLGNAWEWCQDRYLTYSRGSSFIDNNIKNLESIDENNPRLLRGGSFLFQPAGVRSAFRFGTPRRNLAGAAVSASPGLTTDLLYKNKTVATASLAIDRARDHCWVWAFGHAESWRRSQFKLRRPSSGRLPTYGGHRPLAAAPFRWAVPTSRDRIR